MRRADIPQTQEWPQDFAVRARPTFVLLATCRPSLTTRRSPLVTFYSVAWEARSWGTVVIDCVFDENGDVRQLKLVSGHPLLVQAAFDVVKRWKYSPTLLNGKPVPVEMHVHVTFQVGS